MTEKEIETLLRKSKRLDAKIRLRWIQYSEIVNGITKEEYIEREKIKNYILNGKRNKSETDWPCHLIVCKMTYDITLNPNEWDFYG